MQSIDLIALLPLIITAGFSVILLVLVSFLRNHFLTVVISMTGIVLAMAALRFSAAMMPYRSELIVFDSYALFFMALILFSTAVVAVLAYGYLHYTGESREEFYILLLLAALGSMVIVMSRHFAAFFLGLELLTVSLYIMITYLRQESRALEAGVKYLILAGASSAFLLFGMALIYLETGSMEFSVIAGRIRSIPAVSPLLITAGMAMMIVGIGFKLAVVPFHMWTPDVYEGAPLPVTAFVATVSKGAVFALLVRLFSEFDGFRYPVIMTVFSLIAVLSMFTGNLLALLQKNIKRILAYSSIAHMGYLLVAFIAGGILAAEAVVFYLVAYFITMLAAFGTMTALTEDGKEPEYTGEYRGLFWRRPFAAAILTIALFSLAGIPLTSGFIAKYLIISAGAGSSLWTLVLILIVNSIIGLFYYLRIIVAMLLPETEETLPGARMNTTGAFTLGLLTTVLFLLGVYPSPLIEWIRSMVQLFLL